MTMCVLWKNKGGNIHAATDSRLNFGDKSLDHCVKISTLKCQIHEPGDSPYLSSNLKKTIDLTIVFCGGFTNAYTIKETLSEILNRIITTKNVDAVSLNDVSEIAFKVYEKTTKAILELFMDESYGCIFYLIGHCPVSSEMKAFKFSFDKSENGHFIEYKNEELFTSITFEISGSGYSHLKNNGGVDTTLTNAYEKNNHTYLLDVLDSVIKNDSCKSVGGAIQYAECTPDGVILYSMREYENGEYKYKRAGLDVNSLNNDIMNDDFFIEVSTIGNEDEGY